MGKDGTVLVERLVKKTSFSRSSWSWGLVGGHGGLVDGQDGLLNGHGGLVDDQDGLV